jgi:hypothetical protein
MIVYKPVYNPAPGRTASGARLSAPLGGQRGDDAQPVAVLGAGRLVGQDRHGAAARVPDADQDAARHVLH